MMGIQAIFRRSELLLGDEAMNRIAEKRVIIFGVGGVPFRYKGLNTIFIQIKHALHHLPFLIAGSTFSTLLEDGHVVFPLLLTG